MLRLSVHVWCLILTQNSKVTVFPLSGQKKKNEAQDEKSKENIEKTGASPVGDFSFPMVSLHILGLCPPGSLGTCPKFMIPWEPKLGLPRLASPPLLLEFQDSYGFSFSKALLVRPVFHVRCSVSLLCLR